MMLSSPSWMPFDRAKILKSLRPFLLFDMRSVAPEFWLELDLFLFTALVGLMVFSGCSQWTTGSAFEKVFLIWRSSFDIERSIAIQEAGTSCPGFESGQCATPSGRSGEIRNR